MALWFGITVMNIRLYENKYLPEQDQHQGFQLEVGHRLDKQQQPESNSEKIDGKYLFLQLLRMNVIKQNFTNTVGI